MAILKWEFGIGPRGKQKLNFEWETEIYMGTGGATCDQWLDRHQSWSQLGQGMEGDAAMGGCKEPWYENPIFNTACLINRKMMSEVKMLCWCQTFAHTDEMNRKMMDEVGMPCQCQTFAHTDEMNGIFWQTQWLHMTASTCGPGQLFSSWLPANLPHTFCHWCTSSALSVSHRTVLWGLSCCLA